MTTKQRKLIDQIRQAASKCGTSQNQLAIAAGMNRATLCRFISGERGLSMENLDALAGVLKLRIVADGPADVLPAGRPGRKPKATRKAGRPGKGGQRNPLL